MEQDIDRDRHFNRIDPISGCKVDDINSNYIEVYRQSAVNKVLLDDFTSSLFSCEKPYVLTGSRAEGLWYGISDYDVMYQYLSIDVSSDPDRLVPVGPGFVRVRAYEEDNTKLPTVEKDSIVFYNPEELMSRLPSLRSPVGGLVTKFEVSGSLGPATTDVIVNHEDFLDHMLQNNPLLGEHLRRFWDDVCEASHFVGKSCGDHVPSINCTGWPSCAEGWITRPRVWPDKETVEDIVQSGFHLVCKASPGGDPQTEWRLSFSVAEKYIYIVFIT